MPPSERCQWFISSRRCCQGKALSRKLLAPWRSGTTVRLDQVGGHCKYATCVQPKVKVCKSARKRSASSPFAPRPYCSKVVGSCTCGEGHFFLVRLRHGPLAMSLNLPTLQRALSAHLCRSSRTQRMSAIRPWCRPTRTAQCRRWVRCPMPRRSFTRAVIHAPRSIFERRVTAVRTEAAFRCGCAKVGFRES